MDKKKICVLGLGYIGLPTAAVPDQVWDNSTSTSWIKKRDKCSSIK